VPALADLLTERLNALVAAEVTLTPAAVRSVVETLGGGSGRHEIAAGTRLLAEQVGVNVRTVQRWQKEPGTGEARDVTRTRTPGVTAAVQGIANAQGRGGQRPAVARRGPRCGLRGGAGTGALRQGGAGAADQPDGRGGGDPSGRGGDGGGARRVGRRGDGATAEGRAEAADLFGSVVLDQYGIAASAEFTDMHALDISY